MTDGIAQHSRRASFVRICNVAIPIVMMPIQQLVEWNQVKSYGIPLFDFFRVQAKNSRYELFIPWKSGTT